MLAVWDYIEADFRRDYGIRLNDDLPHMSWREFQVLLRGINPYGAVYSHYAEKLKEQRLARQTGNQAETSGFWAAIASIRPRE